MLDISQILCLNACGNDEKNLHKCLIKLGYSIPKCERNEDIFGVSTRDALMKFQTQNDLRRSGKLDEITKSGSKHFIYHKG